MAIISTAQQIVDLYNTKNNFSGDKALLVGDVTFGTPVEALKDDTLNRNTETVITAVSSSTHFKGALTLSYRRIVIGFEGTEVIDGDTAEWAKDDYAIGVMNAHLQVQYKNDAFTADDLTITRRPQAESGYYEVQIVVKDHLKFLDATVVFAINQTKTDLSTTNGELDGFSQ